MLRLVSQIPQPLYNAQAQPGESGCAVVKNNNSYAHPALVVDIKEITTELYTANFYDMLHALNCEIILEKRSRFAHIDDHYEEGKSIETFLVCNFPQIDTQRLGSLICCDEYLQAMLIIQFQLNILEQMLLFCEEQGATYLTLNFNDSSLDYLEIYQNFIISQEEIITSQGEQTEIVIPSDVCTYDDLLDFMDNVKHEFLQTLWRDQKVNGAYRTYLKSQTRLEFY